MSKRLAVGMVRNESCVIHALLFPHFPTVIAYAYDCICLCVHEHAHTHTQGRTMGIAASITPANHPPTNASAHTYARISTYTYVCMPACIRAYMHTVPLGALSGSSIPNLSYMHTYIHIYIPTYIHTHMHPCIHCRQQQ